MAKGRLLSFFVVAFALLAPGASAKDQKSVQLGSDRFVSGETVEITERTAGDVLAAGGEVTLSAPVGGDAVLTGGELDLNGPVAQDVYAAGGEIRIEGAVSGSARLAGGEIALAQGATVSDGLSAAGGEITIDGEVGDYATLTGGRMIINGVVNGDVAATGGSLRLGPGANIAGELVFRGPRPPDVAAGAEVRDGIRHIATSDDWDGGWAFFGLMALIWILGWALAGVLLLALLPNATRRVTALARERTGRAALAGILFLVLTPIAIIALFALIIGIPSALLAALIYLTLVPLGYLAGVASLSDRLLSARRREAAIWRIGVFVLTLIAVTILTQIPFVGWLAALLLVVIGVGALLLALRPGRPSAA